jgi:GTP-binding protein EngB required for normal cell division
MSAAGDRVGSASYDELAVAGPAPERALAAKLDALEDALGLLRRHGVEPPPELGTERLVHGRGRLRHGSAHTVVALVGSTGSGKSSLLNALVGQQIARSGVTRPTTSVTQGVVIGDGGEGLLDLIGVSQRHRVAAADTDLLAGLVLLDLPDFDSVSVAHRLEVDRLVTLVDLLVWVTDPQKYADETLHDGYLRRFNRHADVMQVVLNKVDTVPPRELDGLTADLARLLEADGLAGMSPIPTSTMTPDGVDALRGVLAAEVSARRAALDRIAADLRAQAEDLAALVGLELPDGRRSGRAVDGGPLPDDLQQQVEIGLAHAAGVDAIAALVAAQHRRDAVLATGWPPMRIIRRLRRAPLSRLSITTGSSVATAEVSRTLRAAGDRVVDDAGAPWATAVDLAVRDRLDDVTAALDTAVSRDVQVLRQPPRWWSAVGGLHKALLAIAVVGGVWLGGLFAARTMLLLDVEALTPRVGVVPVPTAMLLGGVGAGLLLALLARLAGRIGAGRQAQRAVASLRASIGRVAADEVVDPLRTVVADRAQVADLLARAAQPIEAGPASQ